MRPRGTRRSTVLAALLALGGCGGGGTDPGRDPASVTLSATSLSFASLLATSDLVATVRDAAGASISTSVAWATDAPSVATVSNAGRVTAVSNGTARVIASVGALADTTTVDVQQVAATLTLTPDTLRLPAPGDTATIGRTVRDAGGSPMTAPVTFATLDPGIAAVVVDTGRVTAVAEGSTTVTAQVEPGGPGLTKNVRVEVGGDLPPAYLVGGYLGTTYTDQIGPATGGGGGFTYVVTNGALPPGLSLGSSTAQITGVPNTSGAYFFEVTASNGVLTLSERYAITISTRAATAFNLWLTYNGGAMPSANALAALSAALARMEEVVTGDAGAAVTYPSNASAQISCSLVDEELFNSAFVEDIAILMAIGTIDGPGNTLARAGPCGFGRQTLPAVITGQMLLDQVDQSSASATYLQDVIWHEMGHVLGIGTLWQGSTTGVGTPTVIYNGVNGNAEWRTLGGPQDGVPLEPDLGAHWHEAWFNSEIMTPTTEGPAVRMPISRMTIATLLDLGWTVSLGAADAYALPGCAGTCPIAAPVGASGEGVLLDDVVIEPLLRLPPLAR